MMRVVDDDESIDVKLVYDESGGGVEEFKEFMRSGEDKFDDMRKVAGTEPLREAIRKRKEGAATAGSKVSETPDLTGYSFFDVVEPPINLHALSRLYKANGTHGAAIRAKVANIVGLGYEFHENEAARRAKRDRQGNQAAVQELMQLIADERAKLEDWLDSCNMTDEFIETLRMVWTDVEATGNGYLEVGRKLNGEIGYLGHVQSHTVRIRRRRDGFVQIVGKDAIFFRNLGDLTTTVNFYSGEPNEIIHFKKYDPTNAYYGVPDWIGAENSIITSEFADRYNQDFFENKAVPRYLLVIRGGTLGPETEAKLTEFFSTQMRGQHHRTAYISLPDDGQGNSPELTIEPVETKIQDVSFVKLYTRNRDEILAAHGVPLTKIMSASNTSLASARDMDRTFRDQVCRPEQKIVEKKLRKIFKAGNKSEYLKFHLTEMTLTDEDTLSKIDERYARMQVKTPNEIRQERFGWEGIPEGDKVLDVFGERKAAEDRAAQQRAEQRAQAQGSRQRDRDRSAASPDSDASSTRAPAGEGRQVE